MLRRGLMNATATLRNDMRNGLTGDDDVTDVVDPHQFPFAWERTHTLRRGFLTLSDCISRIGEGKLAKQPSEDDCKQTDPAKYPNDQAYSQRFQYLPFDVNFANRGDRGARVTSYINNVHPQRHQPFYYVLEKFIDATLPLFNRTLIDLKPQATLTNASTSLSQAETP